MPNWSEVLTEIEHQKDIGRRRSQTAFDSVRRKYLKKLHKKTQRNIIAYYSGWLQKPPIMGLEVSDDDKNAFMMAIHKMDRSKGLDLILHTPGGSIAAAESLVNYLRQMFGLDIRAIVPQLAMSAGTMIACSCKSIVMGKHSNLGPIDPQINGVPAQGVVDEVEKAYIEISADPERIKVWQFILSKYTPTYIGQCENAIEWSRTFVAEQLQENMLHELSNKDQLSQEIVERLLDYKTHKAHNRHIHMDDCIKYGLVIEALEDDAELQDLVLTVHHCFMNLLGNTTTFKIVENHMGIAQIGQIAQIG